MNFRDDFRPKINPLKMWMILNWFFFLLCSSHNLDEKFFSNNPMVNVLQVRWHPASPKDCTLLVLVSNNSIRWVCFSKICFEAVGIILRFSQSFWWFKTASCVADWTFADRFASDRNNVAVPDKSWRYSCWFWYSSTSCQRHRCR